MIVSPFDRNLSLWGNMFQPSKMTQIWKFVKRKKLFFVETSALEIQGLEMFDPNKPKRLI